MAIRLDVIRLVETCHAGCGDSVERTDEPRRARIAAGEVQMRGG